MYREDGVIAWSPYTDHEPVEMVIRHKHRWKRQQQKEQSSPVPNHRGLTGNDPVVTARRKYFVQLINERLAVVEHPTWQQICYILKEAGLLAAGPKQKPHQIPWLRGHEDDKKRLEKEVEDSKAAHLNATEGFKEF